LDGRNSIKSGKLSKIEKTLIAQSNLSFSTFAPSITKKSKPSEINFKKQMPLLRTNIELKQ